MSAHARPGRLRRTARFVWSVWTAQRQSRHRAPRGGPSTPPLGEESYPPGGLDGRTYRYVLLLTAGSFLVLFVLAARLSDTQNVPPDGSQYRLPSTATPTPHAPRTPRRRASPRPSPSPSDFAPPMCVDSPGPCVMPSY
jgi:hypothetical protein